MCIHVLIRSLCLIPVVLGAHQSDIALRSPSPIVIRGVNLGGWLLTEPWISPSLFTSKEADEWTLCNNLGKTQCLSTLRDHWDSFYTRDDLVKIQAAGLNSVRIPVGYWAVDVLDYEPYVSGQYPYLIRAVNWAKELELTVLVDLHGAPGSQNGQDNSGLVGPVEFQANATNRDRSLKVLQNLTEEFAQPIYGGVVRGIELLNEPRLSSDGFTMSELKSFYTAGSSTVVTADLNNNMNVTIHDAFYGPQYWENYNPAQSAGFTRATQITLDTHQYYAFTPLNDLPHDVILGSICNVSQLLKSSSNGTLPTIVGEWSLETGHPPNSTSSQQNGQDTQTTRTWLRLLFEAQIAAYSPNGPGQPSIGWYFWTWKTEYDIDTWSYRKGLAEGYIPSDVGNASTLAFPVMQDGCVDASFNYTAPKKPGRSAGSRSADRHWSLFLLVSIAVAALPFM